MSGVAWVRKAVMGVSVGVGVVGLALAIAYRMAHHSIPLWDETVTVYGLIFSMFLGFDVLARELGRARMSNGRRPLVVRSDAALTAPGRPVVRLVRATDATRASSLATLVEACLAEVSALEGRPPLPEAIVHWLGQPLDQWVAQDGAHPFLVMADGTAVGCLLVSAEEGSYRIALVYVKPGYRRRGIASAAMAQTETWIALLAPEVLLCADTTSANARAIRFWQSCGFQWEAAATPRHPMLVKRVGGAPMGS
ncbi:hypothetical protein GCM10025857_13340 [Alicyclobacillus contaminans]|uniref:GNAT family N-acetyltransferase n=1 Tax=Alicyclobacillus contaminans TaxID=392016 RepID=UPI000400CFF4|nr:GNAT family N-acetyltransferase [Alicyclobacillus contaminans]GMA49977.1 hypothetical protein GCM10025857_13340 [Alicyclobacillus contaminans]